MRELSRSVKPVPERVRGCKSLHTYQFDWLVVKQDHAGLLLRNSWCESMQASQFQCSSKAEHPPDKRKTLGRYQALEPIYKRDEGEGVELPALEAGVKQVRVLPSRPEITGCLAHAGERRSEEPESRVQLPDSCQTARKH